MSSVCKKDDITKSFKNLLSAVEITEKLKAADNEKATFSKLKEFCDSNCPGGKRDSCLWANSGLNIELFTKECDFLKTKHLSLSFSGKN